MRRALELVLNSRMPRLKFARSNSYTIQCSNILAKPLPHGHAPALNTTSTLGPSNDIDVEGAVITGSTAEV